MRTQATAAEKQSRVSVGQGSRSPARKQHLPLRLLFYRNKVTRFRRQLLSHRAPTLPVSSAAVDPGQAQDLVQDTEWAGLMSPRS